MTKWSIRIMLTYSSNQIAPNRQASHMPHHKIINIVPIRNVHVTRNSKFVNRLPHHHSHQSPCRFWELFDKIIIEIFLNIFVSLIYSIRRISVQSFIVKTGNIDDSMMWPMADNDWRWKTWLKNAPAKKKEERRQNYEFWWYFVDFIFSRCV